MHQYRRPASFRAYASALAAAAACNGDGDRAPFYESFFEGDDVVVNKDGSMCSAHLRFLDEHVSRLEDVLMAPPSDELVSITIHDVVPIPPCRDGVFGCYVDGQVHSYWWAVDHEIVHAVHSRVGSTTAFWREGLAEALRGKRTQRGTASVLESIDKPGPDLDYATAGHFVRWLIENYGVDPIPALARGEPFESMFDVPLETAAAMYEATAPWSFPGDPARCDFAPVGVDGLEVTSADVEVGCDDGTAFQYLWWPTTNRTLAIETAGTFEFSVSPGFGVFLIPCQLENIEDEPESDYLGDVLIEGIEDGLPSYFGSGAPSHVVQLEPAKYLVTFIPAEGVEGPQTVTFEFRREP